MPLPWILGACSVALAAAWGLRAHRLPALLLALAALGGLHGAQQGAFGTPGAVREARAGLAAWQARQAGRIACEGMALRLASGDGSERLQARMDASCREGR